MNGVVDSVHRVARNVNCRHQKILNMRKHLLGGLGQPEDIASAVIYLGLQERGNFVIDDDHSAIQAGTG